MEGLRTVLQLTLRVRAAVPPCTGAVYWSESSSANSSDKLNTHSRIEKSASVVFTNNSVL